MTSIPSRHLNLNQCYQILKKAHDNPIVFLLQFEQQRGHSASAVECYMKQHGATMEVAKRELWKQVDDAWKDINEGLLRPTAVPAPLLNMILHIMRMMDVIYREIDIYTFPEAEMKDIITSLFVKPLPV